MECEDFASSLVAEKIKRLSREGRGRDRVSSNYRSFMFGKLPPPACPGLCYESYIQLVKGYHPLPPAAPAGKGYRRILVWSWFSSLCGAVLRTFTIPFMGSSSRASKGEASSQFEAHPCWHCLTLLSEVSRNKLQMQQPSFQK